MADDTTTFVEDINSLENMFQILRKFEQYAGLKLNKTKTEAMWLGKDINNNTSPLDIKWVNRTHSLGIYFSYDTDYVTQKNFMDRAKEFKQILDMWSQRDLSLIGKITILKSLAFSKIIYQCGVITPPQKFIEHIIDLAYGFIWNHKKDKIKRKTIISDYQDGGLRMLDIKCFVKAQKIMWIKRFLSPENASWKALLTLCLEEFLGKDTFKCLLSCTQKTPSCPDFYWQMVKSWCELKNMTESIDTPINVRRQCIWLNENIQINDTPFKWNIWKEKGINIIHDILDQKGEFLTPINIEQKYNFKCDFMKYNALKDAIPKEWRKLVKKMQIPDEAINFNEDTHIIIGKKAKNINAIKNKEIYWILINDIQIESIVMNKLQSELNITEEKCKLVFTMPRVISNTKIRAFQYKLLYNLIPCNLYLKRINKNDTDKCNWCQELDDTMHFFATCKHLTPFWNSFATWCQTLLEEDTNFTATDILVGILTKDTKYVVINACLLLAKWRIYKDKLNSSDTFFYKFLCELKYYINIEKSIALKNNKIIKYNNIWQKVEEQIT